jgi:glucose/arabinose dehydrogenase
MPSSLRRLGVALALTLLTSTTVALASKANDQACAALAAAKGLQLTPVPMANVPADVCASVWHSAAGSARGMLKLDTGAGILHVSKSTGTIVWSRDTNNNGQIDVSDAKETTTILQLTGLNHGITFWPDKQWLVASTQDTVWAWPFDMTRPSQAISASPVSIVKNLPTGGHSSRTVAIDSSQTYLYLSIGSRDNVDLASDHAARALIRRYPLASFPAGGWSVNDGETFASGIRNEVGIAFDRYGILWGVENGADQQTRPDLGDVHQTNPAEEINKFAVAGKDYGYPYCFSEYLMPSSVTNAQGPTGQWAMSTTFQDGTHSDAWCRDTANNVRPVFAMAAHTAPLDMQFYDRTLYQRTNTTMLYAFPSPSTSSHEYLYVAQHGSWNADPAVGYRIQRFETVDSGTSIDMAPGATAEDFFRYDSATLQTASDWNMRPVDLVVGDDGELFLSNDVDNGNIIVLRYIGDYVPLPGQPRATSSNNAVNSDLAQVVHARC